MDFRHKSWFELISQIGETRSFEENTPRSFWLWTSHPPELQDGWGLGVLLGRRGYRGWGEKAGTWREGQTDNYAGAADRHIQWGVPRDCPWNLETISPHPRPRPQ